MTDLRDETKVNSFNLGQKRTKAADIVPKMKKIFGTTRRKKESISAPAAASAPTPGLSPNTANQSQPSAAPVASAAVASTISFSPHALSPRPSQALGHTPSISSTKTSMEPFVNVDVPPFFPDAHAPYTQQYPLGGLPHRHLPLSSDTLLDTPYTFVRPEPQRTRTPPGNKPLWRNPGTRIKPEELRELRELIRQRYHLDHEIWGERFFRERDHDVTEVKMRKADALLDKIRRIVITWDNPEYWDPSMGHHERFQKVKERLLKDGKRRWMEEPPWAEPRESRSGRHYQTFYG